MIPSHKDNLPGDLTDEEAITTTIDSAHVVGQTITDNNRCTPLFHIYIKPPTAKPNQYPIWLCKVHSTSFTLILGLGDISEPFHCSICKGQDYSTGLCPYPSIPSWHEPPQTPEHTNTGSPLQTQSTPDGHAHMQWGQGRGHYVMRGG
jgi:hypothetical protein